MENFFFISGNLHKVKLLQRYLGMPIDHKKIDLSEIQSLDLLKVVTYKAKQAYEIIKQPVLIEDTSLVFHALGKLPGPFIKWFLEEIGNEGLCRLLDNFPDRLATASVMYGLYDGKILHTFSGEKQGTIALHPKGTNGFGWDAIFIPKGATKAWGEMNDQEQDETTLRGMIIPKIKDFLMRKT